MHTKTVKGCPRCKERAIADVMSRMKGEELEGKEQP